MTTILHVRGDDITPCPDTYDSTPIITTINRLLAEGGRPTAGAELVDLRVQGTVPGQPARLRVVAKVLYRASNCVVAVPLEMDAGALKGLEVGVGAD